MAQPLRRFSASKPIAITRTPVAEARLHQCPFASIQQPSQRRYYENWVKGHSQSDIFGAIFGTGGKFEVADFRRRR
jgi:hypothetical protein